MVQDKSLGWEMSTIIKPRTPNKNEEIISIVPSHDRQGWTGATTPIRKDMTLTGFSPPQLVKESYLPSPSIIPG